jgi:hypothetical protein
MEVSKAILESIGGYGRAYKRRRNVFLLRLGFSNAFGGTRRIA